MKIKTLSIVTLAMLMQVSPAEACSQACRDFKKQVITAPDGTKFTANQYNNVRLRQKEELSIYHKVQNSEPLSVSEQEALLLKRGRRELLYIGINSYLGHGSTILGLLRWFGVDIGDQDTINRLPLANSEELRNQYYANLYQEQTVDETKDIFNSVKTDFYSFLEQIFPYGVANLSGSTATIGYLGNHTESMICNEDYLESISVTVMGMEGQDLSGVDLTSAEFASQIAQAQSACVQLARTILKRYHITHDVDNDRINLDYLGSSRGANEASLNQNVRPIWTTYTSDFRNVFTTDLIEVKKFANIALNDYEYAYCKVLAGMQGEYDANGMDPYGNTLCSYYEDGDGMPAASPGAISDSYQARRTLSLFDVRGVANFGNRIMDVQQNDIRTSSLSAEFAFNFVQDFFFGVADNLSDADQGVLSNVVNSASGNEVNITSGMLDENVWLSIAKAPTGRQTFAISHDRTGGTVFDDKLELGIDSLDFNFPPYRFRETDLFVLDLPVNELDGTFGLVAQRGGSVFVWENDGTANDNTIANQVGRLNISPFDIKLFTNHDDLKLLSSEHRVPAALTLSQLRVSEMTGEITLNRLPAAVAEGISQSMPEVEGLTANGIANWNNTAPFYINYPASCCTNGTAADSQGGNPAPLNIDFSLNLLQANGTPVDMGNGPVVLTSNQNFFAPLAGGSQLLDDYVQAYQQTVTTEVSNQMTPPEQ